MLIGSGVPDGEAEFRSRLGAMAQPRVLELGTLRWEADRSTHHRSWASAGAQYVMTDIVRGTDVDLVADAHHLPFTAGFDAVIAISVWEHLRRPWVAAEEVARCLKPGGLVYVLTHQTFPLHGYPHDYYRFSKVALADMFGPPLYIDPRTDYQYPAQILPPSEVTRWNPAAPSWLNVGVFARRSP